jgi:hypothetical protein
LRLERLQDVGRELGKVDIVVVGHYTGLCGGRSG